MGFLSSIFNPGGESRSAYNIAIGGAKKANAITDPYYQQAVDQGSQSNRMLGNYLGLNGQDAQRGAYDSFMTSPAYDYQFDQGTRAINSSAAARGMGKSGSNLKSLQGFGQGIYAQQMDNYLNRLSGQGQAGFQGAAGITGNANALGQLQIGKGQMQDASNQAALGNILGIGSTLASVFTGMPTSGNGRV